MNFSNYSVILKACRHWKDGTQFNVFHYKIAKPPQIHSWHQVILISGFCWLFGVHYRKPFDRSLSPLLVDITQSVDGLNRTDSWRKGEITLSASAETSVFCPHILEHSQFSNFSIQTGTYTIGPQFSDLWTLTELHHWLSWFSGWRTADYGLFCFHNHVSQFL